jgi:hypothetical protein
MVAIIVEFVGGGMRVKKKKKKKRGSNGTVAIWR